MSWTRRALFWSRKNTSRRTATVTADRSNKVTASITVRNNIKSRNAWILHNKLNKWVLLDDRLCGLVVRAPGYRSRGPGWIPGANRFPEKQWICVHTPALLGRKSSSSGIESRKFGRRDPSRCPRDLFPQKVALALPTSGGRSVGIVC
jgi:hypothetical protein